MKHLFLIVCPSCFCPKTSTKSYAEKLGYPKGKKVIIFDIDDAGMSFEANQGTIVAMEKSSGQLYECDDAFGMGACLYEILATTPYYRRQAYTLPSLRSGKDPLVSDSGHRKSTRACGQGG